jgi:hypothetical protein
MLVEPIGKWLTMLLVLELRKINQQNRFLPTLASEWLVIHFNRSKYAEGFSDFEKDTHSNISKHHTYYVLQCCFTYMYMIQIL